MQTLEGSIELAEAMVRIGDLAGKPVTAIVTGMEQPLGTHVGNALEVKEAIDVLSGRTTGDLLEVALLLGSHMLVAGGRTDSTEDARAMLEAWKKSGKKFTIGYQNRFRPEVQMLHQCCENDELGEIYFAKAHAIRRRAVPTWGVFLNEYEQGGGPLIDIGTHALDLTLWMMDNYKPKMVVGTSYKKLGKQQGTANAWGDWDPEKFTVEDSAFGFVVMENGATVSVESAWALNIADPCEASTLIAGVKGGADMLDDDLKLNYVKNNRQVVETPDFNAGGVAFYDGAKMDPSELEARLWIDAVINDTEVNTKPEEAIVVTQILEAIYESAKTGKPVYLA